MAVQEYTPVMKFVETLNCTIFRPKYTLHLIENLAAGKQQGKFGMNFPEGDKF
jgi:hypothetical protein